MREAFGKAHSPSVDDQWERGQAIKRRRLRHGIKSLREFQRATGMARNAITAAEDGHGSEGTYQRLEAWLDRFEVETGADDEAPSIEQIEFVVEGDFGVKVTVKGPITDRAALEDSVTKIIRSIREGTPPPPR